jgi:hypothetical protein
MLVKLGKQVKLPANNHFTIKYGTINALQPRAIFVSIHSWATPKHNQRFDKKLRKLTLSVKHKIDEEINYDVFHRKYIVEFDLRASGLQKNKQSFLAIELTLYPKHIIPFPADIYDKTINDLVNNLLVDIKKDRNFTFTDKKLK